MFFCCVQCIFLQTDVCGEERLKEFGKLAYELDSHGYKNTIHSIRTDYLCKLIICFSISFTISIFLYIFSLLFEFKFGCNEKNWIFGLGLSIFVFYILFSLLIMISMNDFDMSAFISIVLYYCLSCSYSLLLVLMIDEVIISIVYGKYLRIFYLSWFILVIICNLIDGLIGQMYTLYSRLKNCNNIDIRLISLEMLLIVCDLHILKIVVIRSILKKSLVSLSLSKHVNQFSIRYHQWIEWINTIKKGFCILNVCFGLFVFGYFNKNCNVYLAIIVIAAISVIGIIKTIWCFDISYLNFSFKFDVIGLYLTPFDGKLFYELVPNVMVKMFLVLFTSGLTAPVTVGNDVNSQLYLCMGCTYLLLSFNVVWCCCFFLFGILFIKYIVTGGSTLRMDMHPKMFGWLIRLSVFVLNGSGLCVWPTFESFVVAAKYGWLLNKSDLGQCPLWQILDNPLKFVQIIQTKKEFQVYYNQFKFKREIFESLLANVAISSNFDESYWYQLFKVKFDDCINYYIDTDSTDKSENLFVLVLNQQSLAFVEFLFDIEESKALNTDLHGKKIPYAGTYLFRDKRIYLNTMYRLQLLNCAEHAKSIGDKFVQQSIHNEMKNTMAKLEEWKMIMNGFEFDGLLPKQHSNDRNDRNDSNCDVRDENNIISHMNDKDVSLKERVWRHKTGIIIIILAFFGVYMLVHSIICDIFNLSCINRKQGVSLWISYIFWTLQMCIITIIVYIYLPVNKSGKRECKFRFLRNNANSLYKRVKLLLPLVTHFGDVSSDIGTIIEYYNLSSNTKDDNLDYKSYFVITLFILLFSRILSSILLSREIKYGKEDQFLQLCDVYIFKIVYISAKNDYGEETSIQSLIKLYESVLESSVQALIGLYIIMYLWLFKNNSPSVIIIISTLFSLSHISSVASKSNEGSFDRKYRNALAKIKKKTVPNPRFILRRLVRLCDIWVHFSFYILIWMYFGGVAVITILGMMLSFMLISNVTCFSLPSFEIHDQINLAYFVTTTIEKPMLERAEDNCSAWYWVISFTSIIIVCLWVSDMISIDPVFAFTKTYVYLYVNCGLAVIIGCIYIYWNATGIKGNISVDSDSGCNILSCSNKSHLEKLIICGYNASNDYIRFVNTGVWRKFDDPLWLMEYVLSDAKLCGCFPCEYDSNTHKFVKQVNNAKEIWFHGILSNPNLSNMDEKYWKKLFETGMYLSFTQDTLYQNKRIDDMKYKKLRRILTNFFESQSNVEFIHFYVKNYLIIRMTDIIDIDYNKLSINDNVKEYVMELVKYLKTYKSNIDNNSNIN